jgi:ubiquinone/menaquinone biosynthesis C-methylase UbiE
VADGEYPEYFSKLSGLRKTSVQQLPIQPGMQILDLTTGYGFFAVEVARHDHHPRNVGIDLSKNGIIKAEEYVRKYRLDDRIEIIEMDATEMKFPEEKFDMVVNFLGLEDIHMTRSKVGVEKTFGEVYRVLKPGGYFCFVVMPPEEMETEAQKIEVRLFSFVCGATWLNANEYERILQECGFETIKKESYRTGKKLTADQAKEEIMFSCTYAARIYGVETPSFGEVWKKFGDEINQHGMGHYSKVVLFIARKVGGVEGGLG